MRRGDNYRVSSYSGLRAYLEAERNSLRDSVRKGSGATCKRDYRGGIADTKVAHVVRRQMLRG